MNNKNNKRGFTLVELIIAIGIFMSFMLVATNSFLEIIRAQKTANETRLIYSEMRSFVDYLNNEMHEGSIDYFCYNPDFLADLDFNQIGLTRCNGDAATVNINSQDNLRTISKDGLSSSIVKFDAANNRVCLMRYKNINGAWERESGYENDLECDGYKEFVFANLKVKDLRLEIFPKVDPKSNLGKTALQNQIQPMVKVYMDVGSKLDNVQFDLKFQTLITARN